MAATPSLSHRGLSRAAGRGTTLCLLAMLVGCRTAPSRTAEPVPASLLQPAAADAPPARGNAAADGAGAGAVGADPATAAFYDAIVLSRAIVLPPRLGASAPTGERLAVPLPAARTQQVQRRRWKKDIAFRGARQRNDDPNWLSKTFVIQSLDLLETAAPTETLEDARFELQVTLADQLVSHNDQSANAVPLLQGAYRVGLAMLPDAPLRVHSAHATGRALDPVEEQLLTKLYADEHAALLLLSYLRALELRLGEVMSAESNQQVAGLARRFGTQTLRVGCIGASADTLRYAAVGTVAGDFPGAQIILLEVARDSGEISLARTWLVALRDQGTSVDIGASEERSAWIAPPSASK